MGDEGESRAVEPEQPGKKRRRKPMRVADGFDKDLAELFAPHGPQRPPGPPPRRPPNAVGTWFKRGKLWDDVFTRTLSGVLTVGIVAVFAALFGFIQFDQQGWAVVVLVGGIVISIVVVNVWPVRYLSKQWIRWVIFWVLIAFSVLVAWWLYGPIELPTRSGSEDL